MDLIIYNAIIHTLDHSLPTAEAIAITSGKITSIGGNDEILKLKTASTQLINAEGHLVLPGFNDSHMHLINYGISNTIANLEACDSISSLISLVKNFILTNDIKKNHWVRGMKWNHHLFSENRMPTRYDLDKISTEHPILLSRICGHVAIANSKALELAEITSETKVKGGSIDLDSNKEPLGILRENAIQLVYDKIPEPTLDEMKDYIITASNQLLGYGITSVQTDDFIVNPKSYPMIIRAYEELQAENKLPVRVYQQCNFKDITRFKGFLETFMNDASTLKQKDSFFKLGPLKLLADGSLGARTAYLKEPYSDDSLSKGIPVFTQEELDEFITTAHNYHMQVAVHAIGDMTSEMVLNSIELAQKDNQRPDPRHAIIHCQITTNNILNKIKELDVIALVQPLFVSTDLHFVEDRIGQERIKESYNWKGLLDRGVHVAFSSDTPVEPPNALHGIYAAVTRMDLDGYPTGGWLPDQRINVEEAVRAYTVEGAYASFEEEIKGSLTPGKIADLVMLSENIFEISTDKIKDVEVLMTFVHGALAYKKA